MAGLSIIEESNISNNQWAAKIEEVTIPMEKYLLQLEGLASDKRSPITKSDKEYVLERMIEEELLIKRALDLGILDNNPIARGTIVQQMIKTIIAENSRYEVSDIELENFYNDNKKQALVLTYNFDRLEGEELENQIIRFGVNVPSILSDPGVLFGWEAPPSLPATYIINSEGRLIHTLIGPQTQESLELLINP